MVPTAALLVEGREPPRGGRTLRVGDFALPPNGYRGWALSPMTCGWSDVQRMGTYVVEDHHANPGRGGADGVCAGERGATTAAHRNTAGAQRGCGVGDVATGGDGGGGAGRRPARGGSGARF